MKKERNVEIRNQPIVDADNRCALSSQEMKINQKNTTCNMNAAATPQLSIVLECSSLFLRLRWKRITETLGNTTTLRHEANSNRNQRKLHTYNRSPRKLWLLRTSSYGYAGMGLSTCNFSVKNTCRKFIGCHDHRMPTKLKKKRDFSLT